MKPLPISVIHALAAAEAAGLWSELDALYERLPATTCRRRGVCCGLLPPAAPLEMLAWLRLGQNTPARSRALAARRLVRHFLLNAAVRLPCPWSLPGACAIYSQRLFTCRTYGLWSAGAYQSRSASAAAAQEQVAAAWAGLGVTLPPEVLAPPPPYCAEVRPTTATAPGDPELTALEERLHALGAGLAGLEAAAAWGGDLAYATAALCLGEPQCLEAKVAVTRAMVRGRRDEARRALRRAERLAVAWALAR